MKSATTHPTPQSVVDAIHVVASYLREIEAAEAVIAPTGGAAFHPVRKADELLQAWQADRTALLKVALAAHAVLDGRKQTAEALFTLLCATFDADWWAIPDRIREELGR